MTSPAADDLFGVHARLFNDVGRLSLQEYVADADARKVVEKAAAQAETLVDATETRRADARQTAPARGHIEIARAALAAGDTVSALARSRLALEIALRDVAAVYGIDARRQAGGSLIRQLVRAGALDPAEASPALEAFQIASRGLHGEDVSEADAKWAVDAVAQMSSAVSAGGSRPRRA